MDEIDKALAGSDGPQGDGGVASDALGTILFEMEEGTDPVFVVATANDVSQLRPELLRRFDAVFFVDLPTASERADILDVTLRQYNRKVDTGAELVEATSGFSGAEIAKVVKGGLSKAFADGERELTAQDLLNAAKSIVPVSVTMKEKVEELREWRVGRALPASTPETVVAEAPGKRTIEL
jgi:SpoVK/Ycf46/Vps4 family AAA+-type ATPase